VRSIGVRRGWAGVSESGFALRVWVVIGVGLLVRLILAFTTTGQAYDLQSFALVDNALHAHVFGVYHQLDDYSVPPYGRWPYPPGLFPVIVAIGWIAHHTGIGFTHLIRVPAIVGDAAIAWLVQDFLGWRGADEPTRLAAVALVALGPSFIAISGYHGQIDSIAFLPVVTAVILWTRTDAEWRPYAAGALIGIGAAIKTVPLVALLVLAPLATSWREALKLCITAIVIPLAVFVPWLILDGPGKSLVWTYRGGPGLGGISLLTNPSLPLSAFGLGHATIAGLTKVVYDNARWITGAALVAATALLVRHRPPPVTAAVIIFLTVWTYGVTFFLQYMVWGLPFLIMAGYLREVLILQIALLPPTIVTYTYTTGARTWEVWSLYTVPMIVIWIALAVWTWLTGRQIVRRYPAHRVATAR